MKRRFGQITLWQGIRKGLAVVLALLLPCMPLGAGGAVRPDGEGEVFRLDIAAAAEVFAIPYHGLVAADCFRLVSREPDRWSWNGRSVYDGYLADGYTADGYFEGIPLPAGIVPGDYTFDLMVGYSAGGMVCYSDPVALVIRVMEVDGSTELALCSGERVHYVPECLLNGSSVPEKYRWSREAVEGIREKAVSGTGGIDEVLTNVTDRPVEVTYLYVVTGDPCSAEGSFKVVATVKPRISLEVVNRKPNLCEGEKTDICLLPEGISFRWEASTDGALGAEDGEGNRITQTLRYEDLPAVATYRIVSPEGSCMDPTVVGVRVNPLPEIGFEPFTDRENVPLGQPIVITAQPDIYRSYRFVFNGEVTEQVENVLLNYDWLPGKPNRVTVTVVSDKECANTAEIELIGPGLNLPNVMTPNGDGKNDRLMEGFELEVFNRNGSQLYKGKDGWDGYYMGQRVPAATYLYVIHYMTPEGKRVERRFYVRVD